MKAEGRFLMHIVNTVHTYNGRKWKLAARLGVLALLLGACPLIPKMEAQAVSDNDVKDEDELLEDAQAAGKNQLYRYYDNLVLLNEDLTKEDKDKLSEIMKNGRKLISDAEDPSEVPGYVSETKALMDAYITKMMEKIPTTTSEFLTVGDNVQTPVAVYGQQVTVILPIYNLGSEDLTDITVTPTVSPLVNEWPFQIDRANYTDIITDLPGGNANKEQAYANRREVHYTFTTREDVLSGYYKIEYNITYSRNNKSETAKLYSFVKTEGAPGSGSTDGSSENAGKSSTPRIIVTGFETSPAEVYAGDTFMLTIHLKNTSKRTAVTNVEVNLAAAKEGKDDDTLYAAFLPTSGSNTSYIDRIESGGSTDIEIEMTAKTDLVQKPYAIDVKMDYEDEKYNPFTATSSVSIPVRQEAKYDTSTPEVMPVNITVGEQSNVMFSIYNTGKTTLYNVQVKFEADSVSGGEAFIGKIEAGGTGNIDAMVTGSSATMDDGIVKAVVTYEDDAGNPATFTKEIELWVSEPMMDEVMNYEDGMEDPMAQQQNSSTKWIIIGIVAAVIVVIAVVIILIKKKKKKKAAKELEEDLLELNLEDEDKRS